jgi:phenylalanyl-tRNA synthetase beta subunit
LEYLLIFFSFNNLPRVYPNKSSAVAAPLPINKLADIIRGEAAAAGWVEVSKYSMVHLIRKHLLTANPGHAFDSM